METVTKEDLFDDYKLICKMKVGIARKARMLSELFAESPNPWCVTGVTIDALNVFKNADFQKKSKMGVNRSHLVDRNSVYKLMFTNEFDDTMVVLALCSTFKAMERNQKTFLQRNFMN